MSLKTILNGCIGIAIVTLVGCGGGGGNTPTSSNNDDDNGNGPVPPSGSAVDNVTLGGTAAKGIIYGGNVVAEELDASGTVVSRIGSAITAVDGSYTLTTGDDYRGGPIRVTISADENTWMKCDVPLGCGMRVDNIADSDTVIDFGEWYKPGNLTMMALVAEAVTDDSISVNITPYTDLAANRAMAADSLTAAEVYSANSEVSDLLGGIDILNTEPLDITDATVVAENGNSATRITYAALSAAIAALAVDPSGGNPDINAALATLWNSFRDGTIIADDTGTATDDSTISLQEIVNGATGTFAQIGIADTSGVVDSLQADINDAPPGGSVDPQPGSVTGGTTLARVKAFVNDVRTWGTVIEEETRVKGEAFGTQVDLASTAADASMELVVGPALGSTIEAIFLRLTTTTATELGGGEYVVGMPGDPQFESGTITYSGGVVTITDGLIDGVTVNLSVQLPDDKSTVASLVAVINSATLMSESTELTIDSGSIDVTLATPYSVDYAALDMGAADEPDISGGSVTLRVALTQKQDDSGVMLASPVTFTGTLLTTLVNPVTDDETGKVTWLTPATLTLKGGISDTVGNSFEASLTVNISNADTFAPVGESGFDSDFALEENGDNWLAGTIGLDFVLQLDGLPTALINISGDRTAFETGTATVTVIYGARQIIIAAALGGGLTTGTVTITNQDGVAMSIVVGDFDALTGDIEYNGQMYGSIATLNNGLTKITYIDGTFESL